MNRWKCNNFFDSLRNALNGVKEVLKNERNIRIQSVFAILAIILGILLKIHILEFCFIIIVIFIVLICEFFNTALERAVDVFSIEYNENAKKAKDVAAAAVYMSAILSIIIGILVFIPKIINILMIGE